MNIWRTEKVTRGGWIEVNKNSSQELLAYVPTLLMNNHQSHTHTHMESDVLTLGVIIKQRWSGQITLEASDRRLRKYCWTLRATGYSGKLPDGPTLSGQHARELKKNLETQPNDLQKSQNLNHSFVFRWRTSSKRIHTKKTPQKHHGFWIEPKELGFEQNFTKSSNRRCSCHGFGLGPTKDCCSTS